MAGERSGPATGRGLSEITGLVLLFGLVIVGAVIVVMTGTAVQDGVTEQSRVDSATQSLQEVDAELTSLTRNANAETVALTPAEREGESVTVVRGDAMTVRVDADGDGGVDCQATVGLDAIHYVGAADDTVVVYQAGGVWRHSDDGTVTVSPPGVSYREGTLEFSLVNLASDLEAASGFSAERLDDASQDRTRAFREDLFEHAACTRPDEISIEIDSEYDDAWRDHLVQEMPDGASLSTSDGNVTVTLTDSLLARAADDDRNGVIDFTNASKPGTVHGDGVSVDKGAGNTYDAELEYVTARLGHESVESDIVWNNGTETTEVQETIPVEDVEETVDNDTVTVNRTYWDNDTVEDNETVIEGAPLDVEFVIDESNSMDDCGILSGSDCTTRLDYAVQATESFLGTMPEEKGRAGLVGYSWRNLPSKDMTKQYQSLTASYDAVNGSLGALGGFGSTPIDSGLATALDDLADNSNDDYDRMVVLLSDGHDNRGDDPMVQAERAADMNVTVHTISVGDADETLMQDIAAETGGQHYPVSDAAQLEGVFESIVEGETTEEETEGTLESEWVTVPVEEVDDVTRRDEVEVRYEVETEVPNSTVRYDRDVVRQPVALEYRLGGAGAWQTAFASGTGLDAAVNYRELGYRPGDYRSTETMALADGDRVWFGAEARSCASEYNTSTTMTDGGDTYHVHRCDGTGTSSATTTTVLHDGQSVPEIDGAWWQDSIETALPGQYTDGDEFDLASNEVAVVVESPGEKGYAVMVYEVGRSDEVTAEWVVDFTVDVVDVAGAD